MQSRRRAVRTTLLLILLASSLDASLQAHDVARDEIEQVGVALVAWWTDQVAREPAPEGGGCAPFDVLEVDLASHGVIEALLVPDYLAAVPEIDPWGEPYEYRLNSLVASHLVVIRSAAADGLFEGTVYNQGATQGPDEDLVWLDFGWVRRLPDAGEYERQLRARREIRDVGTATMSWITDQIGFGPPASPRGGNVDLGNYTATTHGELAMLLEPNYIRCLPEVDSWGQPYDYYLDPDLTATHLVAIRSRGSDRVAEGDVYPVGGFPPDAFEQDLVWTDGFWSVYPDGAPSSLFVDGFEFGLWGIWLELPTP